LRKPEARTDGCTDGRGTTLNMASYREDRPHSNTMLHGGPWHKHFNVQHCSIQLTIPSPIWPKLCWRGRKTMHNPIQLTTEWWRPRRYYIHTLLTYLLTTKAIDDVSWSAASSVTLSC